MFIDEGFGTLDSQNIQYIVENIFDNFNKTSNLKLYFITHVKLLQNKIDNFINLNEYFGI